MAIAASLAFVALGAVATYSVMSRHVERAPVVASAGAQQVRFSLVAPSAVRVTLVGDFNGWNPAGLPMRRSASGDTWEVEVGLAPGRYTYAFVVDGHLARDPSAAQAAHDDFGAPSSVLLVKGS
jgi:1,4-alpha-glucan branching enzyme